MDKKQKHRVQNKSIAAADIGRMEAKSNFFWVIFIGLSILLIYPPFFRGLFFTKELLPTHAYSALLFGLWWAYKLSLRKDASFLTRPLDYAVLGITAAYALSLIPAVNTRLAIGELLKNINYFIAFWLAAEAVKELKKPQLLLNILLINITLTALLGIGAAAGTFDYPGALTGGRISSTLQYPNTLATYLTAGFFLSMTLFLESGKTWGKYIYSAANFTLIFVFIFTYSRGAWLAFPLVLILYLIGISGGKRLEGAIGFIMTFVPAFLCLQGFNSAISAKVRSKAWLWYIIGVLLSIGLSWLSHAAGKYLSRTNKRKAAYAALSAFIIFAALFGVVLSTRAPITLGHTAEEEDGWKTVRRQVKGIKPDTDYKAVLDIVSENPGEKQYSWRIVIQSINEEGEAASILTRTGGGTDGTERVELPFSTMSDTNRLRINFYNRFSDTYASYDNISICEIEDRLKPVPVMTSFKYIPENIVDRLGNISLEQSSASGRLEFYRDAFKIIKDYPIIGAGGGGWVSLYHGYQSRLYWTTEVHSFPLQLWIETGTFGFTMLCAAGFILIYGVFKFLKNKNISGEAKNYVWAAFIGAFALIAHSAIDFNLSLGAVAFLLWSLVGIAQGSIVSYEKEYGVIKEEPERHGGTVTLRHYVFAMIPAILIMAVSLSFLAGERKVIKAKGYLEEGYLSEAIEAYDRATGFDPFSSEYRAEKAQLLEFTAHSIEDISFLQRAGQEYEKMLKFDRYSAKNHSVAGFYYLGIGRTEKGFEHIERAIELNPYLIDYYEEKAYAHRELVEFMIENRNSKDAVKYISSTLGIAGDLRILNEKSTGKKTPIEMTYGLLLDLEKLVFMGKEADNRRIPRYANRLVLAAIQMFDTIGDGVPDFWKLGNSNDGEISVQIKEEEDERMLRLENPGDGRGYIYTGDFSLQPDDWYLLTFKARGNTEPGNTRIYIGSRAGESTQGSIDAIEVSDEWREYELEILTTKDIEPGKQYIRIDHQGKDSGYFEIKDLTLQEW